MRSPIKPRPSWLALALLTCGFVLIALFVLICLGNDNTSHMSAIPVSSASAQGSHN